MQLTEEEQAMLAGERGPVRQWAIEHQVAVGEFFDAPDLVPVGQAHIMADTESLGESGVAWLEELAAPRDQRRVRIPTITDPRGLDFATYKRLKQTDAMAAIEARASRAFEALGVLMTNTCINYQTILPPVRGEHLAMGDTGVVIYSNSVMGARSNFEGGPSALAAGLTGRTPRYGYHLDRASGRHHALRRWSRAPRLTPTGARSAASSAAPPTATGRCLSSPGWRRVPNSDELKHFGAALASYGSVALFHMPGVTPEAASLGDAFQALRLSPGRRISGSRTSKRSMQLMRRQATRSTWWCFAAPQLSLIEMQHVAGLLDGRRVHQATSLVVATSPEIKFAADRMGLTQPHRGSGRHVAAGVCFYQMYAREMAEANGWQRLLTNSAKLVNILGGYGYKPTLASMQRCVDSAVAGKVL